MRAMVLPHGDQVSIGGAVIRSKARGGCVVVERLGQSILQVVVLQNHILKGIDAWLVTMEGG